MIPVRGFFALGNSTVLTLVIMVHEFVQPHNLNDFLSSSVHGCFCYLATHSSLL